MIGERVRSCRRRPRHHERLRELRCWMVVRPAWRPETAESLRRADVVTYAVATVLLGLALAFLIVGVGR